MRLDADWSLCICEADAAAIPSETASLPFAPATVPGTAAQALVQAGLWSWDEPVPLDDRDVWYRTPVEGAGRHILIFEGLNVLQPRELPKDGKFVPFVSDFFDFSIYIDADEDQIHNWYITRFMRLRETAFRNPDSFFHRYSRLSEDAARAIAEGLWHNINLKNLRENILPTRPRADLILKKGADHLVEEVALRKL